LAMAITNMLVDLWSKLLKLLYWPGFRSPSTDKEVNTYTQIETKT